MPAVINPFVAGTAAPPIPEAREWARRYDGRLGPAIDLTQAVPGYPPHPGIVAELVRAAGDPATLAYGHITGDEALRTAYAAEVNALYGSDIAPDEVAITAGANMGSFAVTMLLARTGDAVMLPVPWYFNHQMNASILGIEVVPLPCRADAGFVPDPGEVAALLDRHGGRVKAILLVTPNNPTGAVYPPETVAAFADLCRRRGIALVLDETYRDFLPAETARPHTVLASDWRGTVVQLYSFSKAYCVPGHRLGAVVSDAGTNAQLSKVLDCLQICAARIGQAALAYAIPNLAAWRTGNRAIMNGRAAACRAAFAPLADDGWRLASSGSYFAYLRHPFAAESSWAVAERLAVESGIVTLPGEAFGPGQADYLRLAFANVDEEAIGRVAERLRSFHRRA